MEEVDRVPDWQDRVAQVAVPLEAIRRGDGRRLDADEPRVAELRDVLGDRALAAPERLRDVRVARPALTRGSRRPRSVAGAIILLFPRVQEFYSISTSKRLEIVVISRRFFFCRHGCLMPP